MAIRGLLNMDIGFKTIVVGAGPAGCAAAYDLAVAGREVVLIDKCEFPRLKPCAGALTTKTVNALPFDVTPVVRRTCSEMKLALKDANRTFTNHQPIAAMTVRQEFDQFFLNHCLARGVEFKAGHRVTGLARDSGGWIVSTNRGSFRGRFLIGADGANSQVRKLLTKALPLRFGLALETCIPADNFGDGAMEFDFGAVNRGYGWVFPKDDHLNVGLYSLNSTIPQATKNSRNLSRPKRGEGFRGRFTDIRFRTMGADFGKFGAMPV